ncbi:MAG: MFS transporter [Gammaproteobacteria bacterium]|nr:MFS transporter [Gammaproteobacteria bacterium]
MEIDAGQETSDAVEQKDYPKLVMLSVLHMAQYFPAAFTGVALPFIFRQQGLPLEMFWLLALPGIPRWFKWAMALVVDNYGSSRIGRRKSWIIPCTMVGAFAYAILALIPPSLTAVHIIIGILLFKSFVMAAQDIAVDAYAAESMTDAERPVGTSLINFLGAVAGVLGSGSVAMVETFGWGPTMLAASALMVIAALPAIIRKEPPPPEASQLREARGERPNLLKALKRKDSYYIMPFLFLFGFGGAFFLTMFGPFWADKGLTLTQYGILAPIAGVAGGALAAISTPWLIGRFGLRNTAIIGVAVLPIEATIYCIYSVMPGLPALPILILTISLLAFATNIYTYAATISRFRWASKSQAGTDYALQSSIWNLGVWVAASTAGYVAAKVGWVYFFPIAAVAAAIGGIFYVVMFDRMERLVVQREQEELSVAETPDSLTSEVQI